ncbi:MAG: phosphatidylserine decarboxylase family protein, partial [Candidatus Methanofastidiosa archaeon]|nr:phosphatidylserine decarboxylase family protein [Candidatus Methanofastidiosa archaeon]
MVFLKRNYVLLLSFFLIGIIIFGIIFYRDPERTIPKEEGFIVSPADGKVISIDKIHSDAVQYTTKNGKKIFLPELEGMLEGNCTMISIFMNILDVHVNRSPISGQVTDIIYISGKHSPAFGSVLSENERNIIVIQGEEKVITIQIAGTVARRIECYVTQGQNLFIGDKIGRIKLGSQVVV